MVVVVVEGDCWWLKMVVEEWMVVVDVAEGLMKKSERCLS